MGLIGESTDDITTICDSMTDGKKAGFKCMIGCFILVGAQIIVGAYWMKYFFFITLEEKN